MKFGPVTKLDKRNTATSKKKKKKKKFGKLWRHCHFSKSWLIWRNPGAGFWKYGHRIMPKILFENLHPKTLLVWPICQNLKIHVIHTQRFAVWDWLNAVLSINSKGGIGFQRFLPITFSFLWIATVSFVYQCYGNVFQNLIYITIIFIKEFV